jgi:tetratricopeptide (TPR) repeat protein
MSYPFEAPCKACDGTGARRTGGRCTSCKGSGAVEKRADDELGSPLGTSATASAAAFQRHFARIFGDDTGAAAPGAKAEDEDWSGLAEVGLLEKLFDIDRRYMREMVNTMPGRATLETANHLAAIAGDYRRIAALRRGGLLDPPTMERKVADALRSQGQAYESLDDLDTAERTYQEALGLYRKLGAAGEANGVERSLNELRLHRDRDVDDAVATLRARLDATAGDVVEQAAAQVELAELHLTRHDDLAAEQLFLAAKHAVEPFREHVTGAGTARSLAASLSAIMSDTPQSEVPSIDTVMRVRGLLQRIYAGMTQILREVDPEGARTYLQLRNEMEGSIDDGSTQNREFSDTMLESLQSLLEQFDRDVGGRG